MSPPKRSSLNPEYPSSSMPPSLQRSGRSDLTEANLAEHTAIMFSIMPPVDNNTRVRQWLADQADVVEGHKNIEMDAPKWGPYKTASPASSRCTDGLREESVGEDVG
ncbi:hypothetical protein LTR91_016962 [Friedmanniomyces endolithicus]|uniref:Uncharacterized protein n=1 Tax=Friedmanniomyces endolithicus TaxID=329885 RepID=A0AAN6QK29_9PEZI|nr:hypothetical protein LTR03_003384 [Friedmanniomyces endolithicus]KAK0880877.1 hypothetical protein LTR87_005370 [Friedmanniomyces endolithicus]KAK0906028.1 hypothetical protein LTR57_018014 [Friedmanniomyces endolithicus]KAK0965342.1 hypothetical protein LTS01_018383 [Friedmanniomyces endolithicus]KAK0967907.1 hypothetical protein LTR91_016962 [Friedmanniomyces endolithicus]